jgi:hypothetical protein
MKKSELNEKFFGMEWSSLAAGLISFLIGNQIKNKVVRKAVMNDPKIKAKIKDLTNRSAAIQKDMEDIIAKQKELIKKY